MASVPGFTERLPKGSETDPEAGSRGDDQLNALIRMAARPKGEWGLETGGAVSGSETENGFRVWIAPRKASKTSAERSSQESNESA